MELTTAEICLTERSSRRNEIKREGALRSRVSSPGPLSFRQKKPAIVPILARINSDWRSAWMDLDTVAMVASALVEVQITLFAWGYFLAGQDRLFAIEAN